MTGREVNFAAVKAAVRMEAVLSRYEGKASPGGRSGRYRGPCPIHRGEGSDAFHVDLRRKIFHCFSCGAGGDVLDLVAMLNKCTLREAALQLKAWFPDAAAGGAPEPARQRVTKGKSALNPPLPFRLRGVDGSHAYLAARNIGARTAAAFGVGFYAGPGLMNGRVVVPIHDEGGRLVAYAGRSVDASQPRYRFPAGFGKSRVLFNFHQAAACGGTVWVVEGFFDCLRVWQAGVESVVALMGTELYEHPAKLLVERFTRVALLLDGDEAGRKGSARAAARLKDWCDVRVVRLPEGAQPDQLSDGQLRELTRNGQAAG